MVDKQRPVGNELPYSTSWEHVSDEMKHLHLLIHCQVLKQRKRQPTSSLDLFKGLVLSEEQINGILSESAASWNNENLLNSEDPNFLTLHNALRELELKICERRAASLQQNISLSLPSLSHIFGLTRLEEQCLIICLAPELDTNYEKLYAYLQDDITRKKPGVGLVLDLLYPTFQQKMEARAVFDPRAPLRKYRLLHTTDDSPDGLSSFPSRHLRLDDRIVNFILGFRHMDARLVPFAQLIYPQVRLERVTVPEEVQTQVRNFVCSHFAGKQPVGPKVVFYFHGPYGAGKQSLAEVACHDLGIPLIIADLSKMLDGPLPFAEAAELLGREATLQPAALCLESFDCLFSEDEKNLSHLKFLLETIQTLSPLTFICSHREWKPQGLLKEHIFIDVGFSIPDDKARKHIWESHLNGHYHIASDVDLGEIASKFRFTTGQIQDAIVMAKNMTRWRSSGDGQLIMKDLYAACRAQSNQKLSTLARKIEPKYSWDDLVLPSDQLSQLRETCNQARYRHIVYGEWGFDRKLSYGKGLNALFSGPSGTGKTMAAEVIANELNLDLYKIDLSQVVSKYIGETEKNLDKIFTEAQTSNAILFFDEADALFGKRSEVKDAHDRYANVEIGYLLQKMEEYDGIAILATNFRQNIDEAFTRRICFIIEFPFPEEEYRLRIWQGIWPKETPLAEEVDLYAMARQFKLTGGNIRNIALAAAFIAAEDGQVVRMKHLLQSTKREFQKMGRLVSEGEFLEQVLQR
jgi:SpoVK/Ycf46/Vps4 family AAA+-type ATPase